MGFPPSSPIPIRQTPSSYRFERRSTASSLFFVVVVVVVVVVVIVVVVVVVNGSCNFTWHVTHWFYSMKADEAKDKTNPSNPKGNDTNRAQRHFFASQVNVRRGNFVYQVFMFS